MITGIDKTLRKIERMKKNLPNAMKELLKEVAEYGKHQAQLYLEHFDTGETFDSIQCNYTDTTAEVKAGGAAIWIEFGTGVNSTPYPYELPTGIVPHGKYGKGKGANPNGWWFPSDGTYGASHGKEMLDAEITQYTYSGTYMVHTFGIDSNPFMTMALNDMIKFLERRGAGVIR